MVKDPAKVKQGKRNKRVGAAFETKTRKVFEEKGWIVSKWNNNIDLQTDEMKPAGNHYIPGRGLTTGKGFPDFVMFKPHEASMELEWGEGFTKLYPIIFVECKTNNLLTKEEKMKMNVLREMGHKCYIAFLAGKEVKYREFLGYEDKTGQVAEGSS